VQRFPEGRGGTIGIESEQGTGTLVRLFLPRVCGAAVTSAAAETEIAYTPSPAGTAAYSTSSTQRRPRRHRSGRERLEHLVVVSDPKTLGEMREHFYRNLRGKTIRELAKDFSRRPL
jgi:hypothetical protein